MATLTPSAASPSGSSRAFLNLADGQMSPLDVLVRSARSAYKPPFLSPLSTSIPIPSSTPPNAGPSLVHASPHSPLLHTRFGTPQKEPHSPAYSDFSSRSDLDGSESASAYSPSDTSPTHRRLSYILDQFEKNVIPPSLDTDPQVPAATQSRDVFLSPAPPGKKKLKEAAGMDTKPALRGTSPVLPGWENSYFPPPERYHAPPASRGITPMTAPSSVVPTPQASDNSQPSPADVFGYRAFEAALSPPLVVINSPDENDYYSPGVDGAFVVEGEALSKDMDDVYQGLVPDGERQPGRAKSYTSGNFSLPRISVSPAASPALSHSALFPSHSTNALSFDSQSDNKASNLPRSNSQPLPTTLGSPLQLETAFSLPGEEASATTPPELSAGASTDADHGFPFTPARPSTDRSSRLEVTSPEKGRGLASSPVGSVYSEYSFYSLVTDESTSENAGTSSVEDGASSIQKSKPPSLVRGDSVSGRYVKHHRHMEPQPAESQRTPQPRPPRPQRPPQEPHHQQLATQRVPPGRPPIPPRPPLSQLPDSRRTLSLSTLSTTVSPALTPLQHLQLGINAHEANKLEIAASHFERAAKLGKGCAIGMVMWGLTLRHGWGMRQDEKRGFVWLRRGVERAVGELDALKTGKRPDSGEGLGEWGAVKEELILAVSEVGRCLMHGWGVKQDKKMGFNYFMVAANLGDTDCAQEVGFCYEKGRGVRRDKKEAARWYRKAVKQGLSDVGLAWIWKAKYD